MQNYYYPQLFKLKWKSWGLGPKWKYPMRISHLYRLQTSAFQFLFSPHSKNASKLILIDCICLPFVHKRWAKSVTNFVTDFALSKSNVQSAYWLLTWKPYLGNSQFENIFSSTWVCKEHCYTKKAAAVGQNGRLSDSCNFFSFWLIKSWGTTN